MTMVIKERNNLIHKGKIVIIKIFFFGVYSILKVRIVFNLSNEPLMVLCLHDRSY